jgi:hypothetical protein
MAGKNANGALVVHTDNSVQWTIFADYCGADFSDPGTCLDANTESTVDGNIYGAVVWLLAAFPDGANPGVTVIFFGIEHNLPFGFIAAWGLCGPAGSLEIPDAGWPDDWATAGNSVAFGSPVSGDTFFHYYWFGAYGLPGNYLQTGINPTGGYAGFVSDDNPGILDEIFLFGRCEWFGPGWNECPEIPPVGACCYPDGTCVPGLTEVGCYDSGGIMWFEEIPCDPNPCPQPGACCFEDGSCLFILEMFCDGILFIPGVPCEPENPCPPPPGACCFIDGTCIFMPEDDCTGYLFIPDTPCEPNPCPQPGACCFEDGTCEFVLEENCTGYLFIPDTPCEPNPCPQPGACCYDDQMCVFTLDTDCYANYNWYVFIPDTACEPNPCPPIAVEETTWGSIKANYR